MAKRHIERVIRSLNGSHDSTDDQIRLIHALRQNGITPAHEGLEKKELERSLGIALNHTADTVIGNLHDIDLVARDPERFEDLQNFPIATWIGSDGDVILGEVDERVSEALSALKQHIHDTDPEFGESSVIADGAGASVRDALTAELGPFPAGVEAWLHTGDELENLNDAVEVIEEHPDLQTRDDYGLVDFRYEAYQYSLSEEAMYLYAL